MMSFEGIRETMKHPEKCFAFILSLLVLSVPLAPAMQQGVGDGGKATEARIESPSGIAVDKNGDVYIAERRGNRIRKVDGKSGIISTVAGTGIQGFSGDGRQATGAKISNPELIALDGKGNLIITDRSNSRIRSVDLDSGIIKTIAGTGERGNSGDGGPAAAAKISLPFGVTVDSQGNIFIADTHNHSIRRIDRETGDITTVAGKGTEGFSGDGGPATAAEMREPHNLAIDEEGNLIIGDSFNVRIREVDGSTGKIRTLYGAGEAGLTEDGESAHGAKFGYFGSIIATKERIIFAEWINKRIRFIERRTGTLSSLRGPDGKPVEVDGPYGIALGAADWIYVAEANKNRVVRIDLKTGKLEHIAGAY